MKRMLRKQPGYNIKIIILEAYNRVEMITLSMSIRCKNVVYAALASLNVFGWIMNRCQSNYESITYKPTQ